MADSNHVQGHADTYEGRCERHGEFVGRYLTLINDRKIMMPCPSCAAERKAVEDAERAAAEAYQQGQARIRLEQERRAAGVPLRFDGKTFANFSTDNAGKAKALAAVMGVVSAIQAQRRAPNLILSGKPGTGKSHLCCAAIAALYRTHYVLRIDMPEMIRRIRDTWRRGSDESEQSLIDKLGKLDLLIIEEVGTGAGSDDERARLFSVMNARYENCLPTIVVTNLGLKQLSEEMGERVVDRLREGERSMVVFDWESQRGAA